MVTQLLLHGSSSIRPIVGTCSLEAAVVALSKQQLMRRSLVSSKTGCAPFFSTRTITTINSTCHHQSKPRRQWSVVSSCGMDLSDRKYPNETRNLHTLCDSYQQQQRRQRHWFSTAMVDYSDHHGATSSSSSSSSAIPFLLADIGEGIAEVELLQWFVNEGDVVSQFDKICEVQSDKATVDITSRYDGRVTRLQGVAGDMIKVGTPLLYVEGDHDDPYGGGSGSGSGNHNNNYHDTALEADLESLSSLHEADIILNIPQVASKFRLKSDEMHPDTSHPTTTTTIAPTTGTLTFGARGAGGPVLTTPAIRKLSKEYRLDLSTIVGTGPKGRVLKGDVLSLLRTSGKLKKSPPTSSYAPAVDEHADPVPSSSSSPPPLSATSTSTAQNSSSISTATTGLVLPLQQDTTVPLRGYSRLMVQTMTASLQVPHMVYCDEVDMSRVKTLKKACGISILPFAIKAVSTALHQYPQLNATYNAEDMSVTYHAAHNIGIAMDTPRGLVVPVIFNCQFKSIADIAADMERFKAVVTSGSCKFDAADLQNATFTLSNIGAIGSGGTTMSPIVTPPQVAIGAMGKIQRLPRFANDNTSMEVIEAHIMSMSWGGDHRVVDGATMARFHTMWKEYMEQPMKLLANLK
jgi:2-oxoisovalerate dehydrogenase E2 component (dihydrolipoyl transacylase)